MKKQKKNYCKCYWRDCPIRLGFELYYQGEKDEGKARKSLLPLLMKFLKTGRILKRFGRRAT